MKHKKLKKRLIIIGVCLILAVGITFGVIALNQNSRRAYIQSVEDLNMCGMLSGQSYYGNVVESAQQKVFAGSDKKVGEVYVSEGDTVKKGDKLFQYDTRLLELSLEEKQLTVTISETSLTSEQEKLETYKSIVPVVVVETVTEETQEPEEISGTEAAPAEGETFAEEEQVPAEEEVVEEEVVESTEKTYTAQEKADLITEQELAVKRAQNQLDSANEALTEAQTALDEAIVTAKLDGTVTAIQDPDEIDATAPFCTIVGSSGMTIKGYVSEFDLGSLNVGDTLSVSSYMTEATTSAEVLSVSDYPADNAYGGGEGNRNTSYYEFTAFMDRSDGFDIGEEVEIMKEPEETDADVIVLSKAYVRSDSSGYYVLKDVDGKLQRQPVTVKKGSDSDYLQITGGLTPEDMIAFPYGSKGKEGLLTTTEQAGPSIF